MSVQAFTLRVYGRVLERVHRTLCRCIFLASLSSSRGSLCVPHNPIVSLFCSALTGFLLLFLSIALGPCLLLVTFPPGWEGER